MQVGHFPASAASSLIQGYCDDFVSLATILAQTLEQVSMRGISLEHSRPPLQRIERGMRELADAIRELLDRGQVAAEFASVPGKDGKPKDPREGAPVPRSTPRPQPGTTPVAAMSTAAPVHAAGHARTPAARPATAPPVRPAAAGGHPQPQRAAPARPAPHAEALHGTSQSMPLLSVFQFLGRMRKSGTMRVRIADENLVFALQHGCVLVATTDRCRPDERLGELLVEHAACTREQLAPIIGKVDAGATERFGQLAVQAGIVKTDQVVAALEVQARRRFTRACKASDAAYEFVEEPRAPAAEAGFRIPPMAIT